MKGHARTERTRTTLSRRVLKDAAVAVGDRGRRSRGRSCGGRRSRRGVDRLCSGLAADDDRRSRLTADGGLSATEARGGTADGVCARRRLALGGRGEARRVR